MDYVDEVVMGVLLARLTRPDAAGLLDRDVDLDDLRERVTDLRGRRDGLASLLDHGHKPGGAAGDGRDENLPGRNSFWRNYDSR